MRHSSSAMARLIAWRPEPPIGYLKRENIGYFRFGLHNAYFTTNNPDALTKMSEECRAGTWRSINYRVFHIFPNLVVSHFRADGQHWFILVLQYAPRSPDHSGRVRKLRFSRHPLGRLPRRQLLPFQACQSRAC